MDHQAHRIRQAIASLQRKRPSEPYPDHIRDLVIRYAAERRERGELRLERIGRELGIHPLTVGKWIADAAEREDDSASILAPVHVVADEEEAFLPSSPAVPLSLVTPSGFRLEGLDPETAFAMLKALS